MNVVPELKFAEYSKLQYTQICFSLQCPMHHQKHTTVKIGLTKKKFFSHPSTTNEQNAKYRKLAILVERSSVGRSTLGPDTPAEFVARRAPLK